MEQVIFLTIAFCLGALFMAITPAIGLELLNIAALTGLALASFGLWRSLRA